MPGSAALAGALALLGFGGPDATSVQQAYDAAKVEVGARHNDDLKIRTAQCSSLGGGQTGGAGRYYCQIDFVRTAEPRGRLYFTVVTIEKRGDAWTLLGGLCKSSG